jgi:type IV secretion system protein VirD4
MAEAREATESEAQQWLSQAEQGLTLGRYYYPDRDPPDDFGAKLIYADDRHALVFGPTSAGKTTRLLMVNLLSDCLNDRSVIVVDPKAELAAVCAKHRHQIGHAVKILDPFGKLREAIEDSPKIYRYLIENNLVESAGFDPLAALDPGTEENPNPNFYDDAAAIGEALIKIEGNDPHWSESAQGLITGLVMWEKVRPKEPGEAASLENVRKLLTEADEWAPVIGDDGELMIGRDGQPVEEQVKGLAATARRMVKYGSEETDDGEPPPGGYEIASLAGRFTQRTDELASIQSTADTQTRWLLSRRIRDDLKKPKPIDFSKLKQERTTVFVVLPAERLRTHSVWLRLVIVSALRALYRRGGLRTLLMIDEMAALGHLAPLEDAFGLVRGYRVQIAGYLQDMAQLKALYKERWESFLANAGVIQSFAPNDLTTADWLSKRSGQTTIVTKGLSDSTSESPTGQTLGSSENWNQIGRARWLPHDLIGFKQGTGVLYLAGLGHGVRFTAPAYYNIDLCERRGLPNPYRGD